MAVRVAVFEGIGVSFAAVELVGVVVGLLVLPPDPNADVANAIVGTEVGMVVGTDVAADPPVPEPYPKDARQASSKPSVSNPYTN